MKAALAIPTYCLGVAGKAMCKACQHDANRTTLNQLPRPLRMALQRQAERISHDDCQTIGGAHFEPLIGSTS